MKRPAIPIFGWSAPKLADAYSLAQLDALRLEIENDPANANPRHAAGRDIYLYTPAARRKLTALSWAVSYKLADERRSSGGDA